jgi:hypothetical protein
MDFQSECLDAATFTVIAPARKAGFVPYAAQYRGVLELDFSIRAEGPRTGGGFHCDGAPVA